MPSAREINRRIKSVTNTQQITKAMKMVSSVRLRHDIFIAGGFLEVKDNKITVIAPAAELPENIDLGRAEKAKSRAEGRLQKRADGIDVERAQLALSRAVERIQVAKHSSGKH